MPIIRPFRGILYNAGKVDGSDVVAPPYDIINAAFREELYQRSPYNIVRVDFGKDNPGDSDDSNKYTRARNYLDQWLSEDILFRDPDPYFYACRIRYRHRGKDKILQGIFAAVEIRELGDGIYPHEATYSKPKADRLNLLEACRANTSPIFSLYRTRGDAVKQALAGIGESPCFSAQDASGAVHELFRIPSGEISSAIGKELSSAQVYIADGHHRYEVALEYRKRMSGAIQSGASSGFAPHDFVLMFLADSSDEGLTILPTHRLVGGIEKDTLMERLQPRFLCKTYPFTDDITGTLESAGKNSIGVAVAGENNWHALTFRETGISGVPEELSNLGAVILQEIILKNEKESLSKIYEMDTTKALNAISSGSFDAVFFLNPTGIPDVERVALAGLRMPPKSTYFYPKLLTGLVIHTFTA